MILSNDINKLYSRIDADPKSYKEIINDEYKLRLAMRSGSLARAIEAQPVEIPPVLVGESFDDKSTVTKVNLKTPKKFRSPKEDVSIPQLITETKFEIEIAVELTPVEPLKMVQPADPHADTPAADTLNVVDLSNYLLRDAAMSHKVEKSARHEPTLASLFNRLENNSRQDTQPTNLLKLRRL
jgi:hypothetical protein